MADFLPVPKEFMPRHVAIIMDGNGRWAKEKGKPRAFGHRAGVEALEPVIEACDDWGIEALTVYAFSTENWARPKDEVNALMGLLVEYFGKKIERLHEKGVCIRILGDLDGMPETPKKAIRDAQEKTKNNTGLKFNVALNYGSKQELLRAARTLAKKCADGALSPDAISEADFEDALYTKGLPPVDLLIRTSGEERISNFLLYQCAYAEFVFVKENWPDFSREVFGRALETYARRDRRFGKV